jgi:hypothetical protein
LEDCIHCINCVAHGLTIGRGDLAMGLISVGEKDFVPVAEQVFDPICVIAQGIADLSHECSRKIMIIYLGLIALSKELGVSGKEPNCLRVSFSTV